MTSLICIFIDICDFRNVSIFSSSKMVPVLATEGELHQTETCARCQQCVEANGAGAGAFIDGKRLNDGAIARGSNIPSNRRQCYIGDNWGIPSVGLNHHPRILFPNAAAYNRSIRFFFSLADLSCVGFIPASNHLGIQR